MVRYYKVYLDLDSFRAKTYGPYEVPRKYAEYSYLSDMTIEPILEGIFMYDNMEVKDSPSLACDYPNKLVFVVVEDDSGKKDVALCAPFGWIVLHDGKVVNMASGLEKRVLEKGLLGLAGKLASK